MAQSALQAKLARLAGLVDRGKLVEAGPLAEEIAADIYQLNVKAKLVAAKAARASALRSEFTELTAEALRKMVDYDPSTGVFRWRDRRKQQECGSINAEGYRVIVIAYRPHKAHRLAWLYVHGHWPAGHIDHINGQKADNRIENLRDVPPPSNSRNRHDRPGVFKSDGAFRAQITVAGRKVDLGAHKTRELAEAAYLAAKAALHHDA